MLLRRMSPWPEKVEDLDGKFCHHCYMNTDSIQWPIDEILSDEGLSPLNDGKLLVEIIGATATSLTG